MANIRYVNTASTPGGDGTTNATSGANRAFASLSEWEAARQAVLSDVEECVCEGSTADTTAVTIDGWTTSASNYIYIHTSVAGKHDGKWNTSKYRLEFTNGRGIDSLEEFVRYDGLQFLLTTNVSAEVIRVLPSLDTAEQHISNCIFKASISTTGEVDGLSCLEGTVKVRNCIFYDFVNSTNFMAGIYNHAGVTAAYFYNITFQNCRFGIHNDAGTLATIKNSLAQNCNDGFSGTFNAASTNNASDIASDAPGSNPSTGTVSFVDGANDDFHLATNDTIALNLGTDLSGDANYAFSDDIDGQTRSGTWDIGADEIITSSQTTNTTNIQGISRIQGLLSNAVPGQARIQVALLNFESGQCRIEKTFSFSEDGQSRIQAALTNSEAGKTSILNQSQQSIDGLCRISGTNQTGHISGSCRIEKANTNSETGKIRIQSGLNGSESGVSRIQKSFSSNIQGVVTVLGTDTNYIVNNEILLKADNGSWYWVRVSAENNYATLDIDQSPASAPPSPDETLEYVVLECHTSSNKYRLNLVEIDGSIVYTVGQTSVNEPPVILYLRSTHGLHNVYTTDDGGGVELQILPLNIAILTGTICIRKSLTSDINGKCLIQKSLTNSETGLIRIENTYSSNLSGTIRVFVAGAFLPYSDHVSGKVAILNQVSTNITGMSRIETALTHNTNGTSRIEKTTSDNESGISRIEKSFTASESGISRMEIDDTLSIGGVCFILNTAINIESINGIVAIQNSVLSNTSGAVRLQITSYNNQSGKSFIQNHLNMHIAAVINISNNSSANLNGKIYIQGIVGTERAVYIKYTSNKHRSLSNPNSKVRFL